MKNLFTVIFASFILLTISGAAQAAECSATFNTDAGLVACQNMRQSKCEAGCKDWTCRSTAAGGSSYTYTCTWGKSNTGILLDLGIDGPHGNRL